MRNLFTAVAAAAFALTVSAPAVAADSGRLDMYSATVSGRQASGLVAQGVDVAAQRPSARGLRLDLVLSKAEVAKLKVAGIKPVLKRVQGG